MSNQFEKMKEAFEAHRITSERSRKVPNVHYWYCPTCKHSVSEDHTLEMAFRAVAGPVWGLPRRRLRPNQEPLRGREPSVPSVNGMPEGCTCDWEEASNITDPEPVVVRTWPDEDCPHHGFDNLEKP